ncbi:MAG: hypothetical protein QOD13_2516 [Thermoleophilaceae bacterium]|jgi:uncharacterized protein with FMN-binding domain|nr:hypothetical protein [Thermoleophilaceae bacterium]
MVRRAPIVLAATVAGVAAVLGYHTHAQPLPSAGVQAPAASAPASSGAGTARRLTGSDAPNKYGDVQVQVTTSGGRITRVAAVRLPGADGRSQQISSYAGPQLAQQALAAQSANIDGVSGATYTSESYRASLQSALDQLPAPTAAQASG